MLDEEWRKEKRKIHGELIGVCFNWDLTKIRRGGRP
jgi:hypothetical protein